MKKLIIAFILLTWPLAAGGVFKSAGDVKWWKGALGVDEIVGYKILESEVSSVHGRKYWAYKVQVLDITHVLKNMNIESIRKLTNDSDLSSARRLLPFGLKDTYSVYYLKKKFYHYHDDIFVISPPEAGDNVMFVVFSAESFSPVE